VTAKFILLEDTIEILRQYGLIGRIEYGPHFKVHFTNVHGSHCCLVMSRTPSCQFAIKKNRAELRRLLRRPAR
jgi:hypothetical protein